MHPPPKTAPTAGPHPPCAILPSRASPHRETPTHPHLLAAALILAATPAVAFQSPADMAAIDAALAFASLSAEDLARVRQA